MKQSYEIEIKSLLGSKENADVLRARMRAHDSDFHELGKTNKHLNHYFVGGDLPALRSVMTSYLDPAASENLAATIAKAKEYSLRSRSADGKILLVLKVAMDNTTSANGTGRLEFEAPPEGLTLDDLDRLILSCGFNYEAKWSREREEYLFCGAHVTIDKNAGYGYLAEFEIVAADAIQIESTKERLRGLMKTVGAEELDAARLERMFAYYNAHWPDYYGTDKVFTVA